MGAYILRRLLLIIPTLFGIMVINFVLVQFLPGGPVEQAIARMENMGSAFDMIGTNNTDAGIQVERVGEDSIYKGARGMRADILEKLEAQYGFDKPPLERFLKMMKSYIIFDFGESHKTGKPVVDEIVERLPVSISLGLWATLISYMIAIPLGIRKAVRDGSKFDTWTSGILIATYAIPGFLFAVMLLVLFAGGSYWKIFPNRGLTSPNFDELSLFGQIIDYFHHITLPVLAMTIGGFTGLTLLTKNSFLDEIRKQYVMTARAKGLTERRVLYGHVFRNAMLIVIAGFPGLFIGVFFAGSLFIETIFSLDGLGRLGFERVVDRDFPVIFATLYFFTLLGLVVKLISDLTYVWIDPRIDFESRQS